MQKIGQPYWTFAIIDRAIGTLKQLGRQELWECLLQNIQDHPGRSFPGLPYGKLHCPKSNPNFRDITWNEEENEMLHEIFSVVHVSHFPRYISCYIAENRLSLGQRSWLVALSLACVIQDRLHQLPNTQRQRPEGPEIEPRPEPTQPDPVITL